jgi:hypothetical protein
MGKLARINAKRKANCVSNDNHTNRNSKLYEYIELGGYTFVKPKIDVIENDEDPTMDAMEEYLRDFMKVTQGCVESMWQNLVSAALQANAEEMQLGSISQGACAWGWVEQDGKSIQPFCFSGREKNIAHGAYGRDYELNEIDYGLFINGVAYSMLTFMVKPMGKIVPPKVFGCQSGSGEYWYFHTMASKEMLYNLMDKRLVSHNVYSALD